MNQGDIRVLYEYTKHDLLHLYVIAITEPRMWLEMSSEAAIPLQLNVGQSRDQIIPVVRFMGCIVKYHLCSCQYRTKYLETE